jgi:hypothetical protein
MIPSGYKEDTVYSAVPTDGSGDLSFTRASNGTRINSAGLVEVCPWNLFTYSEQPNNADWSGGGNGKPTMTDNFAEAPNGTMTASKMEVAGTGYQIRQNNAQENTQMNVSVWLRTNTGTKTIQLFLNNANTASQNITVTTTWTRYEISGLVTTLSGSGRNGLQTLEALTSGAYILVWGLQLSVGLTAKPYFPTTDRLNVPRLTYQNGGGGCPSLLLEKQSTNLFTYSEQFDNADWTKLNTTVSANSTTSPDGTQNADTVTPTTTNGVHRIEQDKATASQVFTQSIFAKANGYNFIALENGGEVAYFNISTGVVGTVSAGTASIQNMGNGWYRCIFTATALNTKSYFYVANADNSVSFAGDSTSGIFVWGCQFEAGSYATSYISTTSASATRVADACSKTGISSLIGQTEGVLFIDYNYDAKPDVNGNLPMVIYDGSNEAYIFITGGGDLRLELYNGGVLQCLLTTSIGAVGRKKIAFAYKQNDFVGYMNGVQVATDTSGTVASMSNLYVGSYYTANYNANGGINQALLFKTRLSNSDLIALTTI